MSLDTLTDKILKNLKTGKYTLKELKEKINVSEKEIRSELKTLEQSGYLLQKQSVGKDEYYFIGRLTTADSIHYISGISPKAISIKIGLLSDTHLNSWHANEEALKQFYKDCEQAGVKQFWHAGDLQEGNGRLYRGQMSEIKNPGFDRVVKYCVENYPKSNLETIIISGNHDDIWAKESGADIVKAVSLERPDLKYLGQDVGDIILAGVRFRLLHPEGGGSVEEDSEVIFKKNDIWFKKTFREMWNFVKGEVSENKEFEIKNITEPIFTISSDGIDEKITKINKIIRHLSNDILRVKTPSQRIICTRNHNFVGLNNNLDLVEQQASSKFIINPNPNMELVNIENSMFGIPLTIKTARWFGLFATDGDLGQVRNNAIGFTSIQKELLEDWVELSKEIGFEKYDIRNKSDNDTQTIRIFNKDLKDNIVNWLEQDDTSRAKSHIIDIPLSILFSRDRDIILSFLSGVIDGDGWVTKQDIGICSASKKFISGCSLLLKRLGIKYQLCRKESVWEISIRDAESRFIISEGIKRYIVSSYKKDNLILKSREKSKNLVYIPSDYLQKLLNRTEQSYNSIAIKLGLKSHGELHRILGENRMVSKDIVIKLANLFNDEKLRIISNMQHERISFEEIKYDGMLYDLELEEEPHNYFVLNEGVVLTHNSYARSYSSQKYIRNLMPSDRPDVLCYGHLHQYLQMNEQGIDVIGIPSFQGTTNYLARKGIQSQVGGLILDMTIEKGKIQNLYVIKKDYE